MDTWWVLLLNIYLLERGGGGGGGGGGALGNIFQPKKGSENEPTETRLMRTHQNYQRVALFNLCFPFFLLTSSETKTSLWSVVFFS